MEHAFRDAILDMKENFVKLVKSNIEIELYQSKENTLLSIINFNTLQRNFNLFSSYKFQNSCWI